MMIRTFIAITLGLVALRATAMQPLVDGQWLQARLGDEHLVILDIRNGIDGGSRKVYERGHIPGAIYSDYLRDGWRTQVKDVVAMLPPPEQLQRLIGGLGIDARSHVVIVPAGVSAADYASATRVYWTFKVVGHDEVSILDGGQALWVAQGRPVEAGAVTPIRREFEVRLRPELIATREDVETAMQSGSALVDNRPTVQFLGQSKHPKAPRPGAIPGAHNIPQGRFFNPTSKRFADAGVLAGLWAGEELSGEGQITYCNTGHWASLGWFAASELLGRKNTRLYDGSMVDWAKRPELPVAPGGCVSC